MGSLFPPSGYVPGDRCLLAGFRKLLQGHALTSTWRAGRRASAVLVSFLRRGSPVRRSLDELGRGSRSVPHGLGPAAAHRGRAGRDPPERRHRLQPRDRDGGTRLPRPVQTFTISFPGHPRSTRLRMRGSWRAISGRCTPSSWRSRDIDLLPLLARHYDEPIGDASMLPTYLVSRLIRKHATVALGGDGGDELFAGYLHYGWIERHARVSRPLPASVRRLGRSRRSLTLPRRGPRTQLPDRARTGRPVVDRAHRPSSTGSALRACRAGSAPGSWERPSFPEVWRTARRTRRLTPLQQATARPSRRSWSTTSS